MSRGTTVDDAVDLLAELVLAGIHLELVSKDRFVLRNGDRLTPDLFLAVQRHRNEICDLLIGLARPSPSISFSGMTGRDAVTIAERFLAAV
jgi:hypothetical protein